MPQSPLRLQGSLRSGASSLSGCSFLRVGCAVFMLHDFNDMFLEAAKMARYTEHHSVRPP